MALPAVTMHRIETVLEGEGLTYKRDSDDDVVVHFDSASFGFELLDQINVLRIYGIWRGNTADSEIIAKLQKFVDFKNSALYLPKLFTGYNADDRFGVRYEYCMPVAMGLTDEQLHDAVITVFSFSLRLVKELEQEFPELVTWNVAEVEEQE